MSKHRYSLPDGRQLLINDPAFSGRAYVYVDGHHCGDYTIDQLKVTQTFILADESQLTVFVVNTVPGFRLFDVRHNGVPLRGSAADPKWSRRTVIELLIFSAITNVPAVVWKGRLPLTPIEYVHGVLAVASVLIALLVWRDFENAPSWARKLTLLQCAFSMIHLGADDQFVLNIDLVSVGIYFWMRHLTDVIEYMPELPEPKAPPVTLQPTHT